MVECKTSFEFVMLKKIPIPFRHFAIATNGKPLLKRSSSFLPPLADQTTSRIAAGLGLASSKVNLLNDTYQWDCATIYVILRTNGARCALNKEILDLLNEESVSGVRIVELVYKFNEKFTTSVQKGKSTVKVPFKVFWGSYTYTVKNGVYSIHSWVYHMPVYNYPPER